MHMAVSHRVSTPFRRSHSPNQCLVADVQWSDVPYIDYEHAVIVLDDVWLLMQLLTHNP